MRLIDKDKLINEVSKRSYSQASMRLLREQPEVEAITIKWIKQYWNTHRVDDMTIWNMLREWEKENGE